MIVINNENINAIKFANLNISKVERNGEIVWQGGSIQSCFNRGYWLDNAPWTDNIPWTK